MLKLGVVGLGAMGQHHARLYSYFTQNPELITQNSKREVDSSPLTHNSELITQNSIVQLVGVADADPLRAKEIGEKYGVPYYTDYHELISRVNAVSIAVPTTLHHKVAIDFLKAGVHCLVEKPIAFSLEEAEDMIQMAKARKVKFAIGHIERFNPAVVKLKEIIDSGTLGKLLIVSTRRVGPFVPRIRDVGVVIDSATHDIGVVRFLIGKEPESVFSRVGSLKHAKEDHAIIVLDFAGTIASIEVNWFTPHKVRTLVVTGSEGIAYLDYIEQTVVVHNTHSLETKDSKHTTYDSQLKTQNSLSKPEPLRLEIENFLKSIILGYKPGVDGEEGKAILEIALESSKNNYVVCGKLQGCK